MAGLENLVFSIYHEKQQEGSMLCAQHALNSLLQGHYFTAPDLSDIARNLDALEHSYDESHTESTNMDDTGFFSVQVLDNALKVWGLNLVRWRGEGMRPYQDHPHTQLAFILNLNQHWFALRRFGPAEPNLDDDLGDGHWFNLNSFLPAPEWVGKLYLGMVLQQAETEGYSVFAVTQADPYSHLALTRTEADDIASTLPEPTSAARPSFQSLSSHDRKVAPTSSSAPGTSNHIDGLEDEDYELQAALQASLMGNSSPDAHDEYLNPPRLVRGFVSLPPSDPATPLNPDSGTHTPIGEPTRPEPSSAPSAGDPDDVDPVAASMERNRLMLQRVKAQQEFAQRELWGESSTDPDAAAALQARREERRKAEEEEAEELRRAIEESQALARQEGHETSSDDEELDDDMDVDPRAAAQPNTYPVGAYDAHRVYDDDDAELQAALRASLEHVPEGWQLPELPQPPRPLPPVVSAASPAEISQRAEEADKEDTESVLSDETSTTTTDNPTSNTAVESVSVDELRRRRLARFGA